MKQSEFLHPLLPLAQKGGGSLPDQSGSHPRTSSDRVRLGTKHTCRRAPQLFRHHRLRPSQRLVERRRHRARRPLPPFPRLRQPRRLLHGLCPPGPLRLPLCRRCQQRRKSLCPENLPKQIHQRSQRRQPRRLPSPLSQNQQKNRKTTSFMILFKIRCLDSSSVMPFFKASSIDMTGYASTTGFSSE